MSDILETLNTGLKSVETKLETELKSAMEKYDGQVAANGVASQEAKDAVRVLSEKMDAVITEMSQKMEAIKAPAAAPAVESAGAEFVKSEQFRQLVAGDRQIARLELKNTVSSGSTTVFPQQNQAIISGDFKPLTIRQLLRSVPVSSNAVYALRESAWTNNAAEVSQGAAKPESALTMENYNVTIQTVAHFIKVTNQLLADAPAVMSYIDTRLRDGLAQRIDAQLLNGNGTSPNLSGITDSGNYTSYTATSGDLLFDSINRAKYSLWAKGYMPDAVIVNPADWGAAERTREGAGSGMYLAGLPGTNSAMNPFGVRIVLSNNMASGKFAIGAFDEAAVVYNRQGATVEMGFINDDFQKNIVSIRAEERLALAVDKPSAILYGDITA